jgi:non-specific protein-tyrosine kinase
MEIAVTDTDPIRSQAVANELVNQLILQSPTNQVEKQERLVFINQQLDELQVSINETQQTLEAKQDELANLNSARQIADSQNQIAAFQTKLNTLQSNYASLLANTEQGASNTITVIEPASLPTRPVGPNTMMTVLTAAAIGFVLAAGAAYLLEYLDNTIKSPEEIKKISDLSMLAGIPVISGERYPEKLITVEKPRSPISEAYRLLRTGIQFSTVDQPQCKIILVTSPNPSEGKSVTAANLAVVMAQAGNRVLMIDSDLRRPVMHRMFQVPNRDGLTTFLREGDIGDTTYDGSMDVDGAMQAASIDGLQVMTSGPIPPNPSELLGSQKMKQFLAEMAHRYDYIVLDSPPALVVTDAAILSTQSDGTLIVVDADHTNKSNLTQCTDRLREVNANLLGVVVNRLSPKADGYYYYYQYYYYQKSTQKEYGYLGESDPVSPDGNGKRKGLGRIFRRKPKEVTE